MIRGRGSLPPSRPDPVGRVRHDGGGRHDGGAVGITEGQKRDLPFHGLDGLSADQKVSHLYAVRLTDRPAARGSESVRGDGFRESLFR